MCTSKAHTPALLSEEKACFISGTWGYDKQVERRHQGTPQTPVTSHWSVS